MNKLYTKAPGIPRAPSCDSTGTAVCELIAKTAPDNDGLWLPLAVHLLDTLAVMRHLTRSWLPERYCEGLGMSRDDFFKLTAEAAIFHDIGKSIRLFQHRITERRPELRERLRRAGLETEHRDDDLHKTVPHGAAGAELLRLEGFGVSLPAIVGAHHGVTEPYSDVELWYDSPLEFGWNGREDRDTAWGRVQKRLIEWASVQLGLNRPEDTPECSEAAQLAISGLVIMADWIASNTAYFPLIPADETPQHCDPERAARAVARLRLPEPWRVSDGWRRADFFAERFGFEANAVQREAERLAAEMKTPGVMIIEAPMGQGKTEAALSAAEILMNRFGLGGAAFFLPSQATSNAMFGRMTRWASRQPDAIRVAVELIHGQAELNAEFEQLAHGCVQVGQGEDPGGALTVHSFFRGRKTKLLANLVIGTVDQLLMAALNRRHVMLRHLGLTGKAVVIDECHAYDAYMNRYLDRVLNWLGAYGVPVILLSATLPGRRRAELLRAYLDSKAVPSGIADAADYPLLSWTDGAKAYTRSVPPEGAGRSVMIERADEAAALRAARCALEHGCVGVIVNTVRRAQGMRELFKDNCHGARLLLDHSQLLSPDRLEHEDEIMRFVGKDSDGAARRGVLVIGTQVLEQSLDLDFDLLITDLCPMDLLLQRIGRLHRHARPRPEGLKQARCIVLGAQGDLEDGARAVYGEWQLLRTRELLPEALRLPQDISPLVQRTYDETPSAEHGAEQEKYKLEQAKKRGRASYLLPKPSRDGFVDSIVTLMDNLPGMTEPQSRAAVRDGCVAIEVLAVQRAENGFMRLLSGAQRGGLCRADTQPDAAQALEIAAQRLRLPSYFSRGRNADDVIAELEIATRRQLPLWTQAPMLEGELFLIFEPDGTAELGGKRLHYDSQIGLTEEKDEAN